jgi:hypothetical protein
MTTQAWIAVAAVGWGTALFFGVLVYRARRQHNETVRILELTIRKIEDGISRRL